MAVFHTTAGILKALAQLSKNAKQGRGIPFFAYAYSSFIVELQKEQRQFLSLLLL